MFNKKLIKFLKERPNITLIGFAWACYWRISLVVMGIYLVVMGLALLVG